MAILLEGITETAHIIGAALQAAYRTSLRLGRPSASHIRDLFSYHFNLLAQYTIGKKLITTSDAGSSGLPSQFLLFVPVIIPSWLMATVVVPTLYHSYRMLKT